MYILLQTNNNANMIANQVCERMYTYNVVADRGNHGPSFSRHNTLEQLQNISAEGLDA